MAGSYADLPAPRIEYDRDGTRVYNITGTTVTELDAASRAMLQNENSDWLQIGNAALFVFPENRDISHGYFDFRSGWMTGYAPPMHLDWSNDSTTGLDGTWTRAVTNVTLQDAGTLNPRYRTDILSLSGLNGVRMLKMVFGDADYNYPATFHLYGKASAGQTLHRLRFWHPTLDAPLDDYPAHLDWGNIQQGSSATRQFRVKNDSLSLSASGVKVFMQALSDASPTQVSQHQLSLDGTTFSAAASPGITVGNLATGAISGALHLKRNTQAAAQLGLFRQRLVATADTWS